MAIFFQRSLPNEDAVAYWNKALEGRMTGFTLSAYRTLLTDLRNVGYEFVDYETLDPQLSHIILRHDVDISPHFCLDVAEVESNLGIKSTYFFLLRSELYNFFSNENLRIVEKLLALGHEVGLHFDATLYDQSFDSLDRAAALECASMEVFLDRPIKVISFHRPAKVFLDYEGSIAGRVHTYAPRFFSDIGYYSDSRGAWQDGDPLKLHFVRDRRAFQLLTHPVWWCGFDGETPVQKLDRFISHQSDVYRAEVATQCTIYRKEVLRVLIGERAAEADKSSDVSKKWD